MQPLFLSFEEIFLSEVFHGARVPFSDLLFKVSPSDIGGRKIQQPETDIFPRAILPLRFLEGKIHGIKGDARLFQPDGKVA